MVLKMIVSEVSNFSAIIWWEQVILN